MAKINTGSPKSMNKPISPKKDSNSGKKENNFLIVGIGASAGGLEAFKEFLLATPDKPGMAFVLVQHLDPTHKSLLVELLGKHTKMKVSEVVDNMQVEPNNVYVIPPNKDMAILKGILYLMEPSDARGFRKPIDFFLRTLAQDQGERAVGIIMSGTGTEGTLSLKIIKGQGGLSIVQDPKTAQYDGMPMSAINAGAEDIVLSAKEIPGLLMKYAGRRNFKPVNKVPEIFTENDLLEKVFIIVRDETGCNFGEYKSSTVIRRIEKRMAINQIDRPENYIKHLQKNPEEILRLFKELLIGVTSFFRDKEIFEVLKEKIIPQIIKQKLGGETIRIWVPGCSTGEEAYSLAFLFNDAIREQNKNLKLQIFASDIDNDGINLARFGVYPKTISADVSSEHLVRYFMEETSTYHIKKEIRDQVIFAVHNIIKDPPFSKQDMISCRNLLIYLNAETQGKIFSIFHYALNPSGILFLGSSESLGAWTDIYDVLDRKNRIFKRRNVLNHRKPTIGHHLQDPLPPKVSLITPSKKSDQDNLAMMTERLLLSNYAPACVIVNQRGDAVYFSGNTGKYLQPSPGEARFNIVDMAREGLKAPLRTIISKVRKSKKMEVRPGVKVRTNGSMQVIELCVRPIKHLHPDEDYLMITFADHQLEIATTSEVKTKHADDITEIEVLEQELSSTKEYLRITIEELEFANEEMKSSNEELQSTNEELQSTNEELETSKEELQSVNEELVTVNSELQGKIDELDQTNDYLNNLLYSTEIGIIFLNSKLIITRFTPSMTQIINLIEGDLGRPIGDISSNLHYNNFEKDLKKVMESLISFKTSVKSKKGIWYQMQITPYRTSKNVIDGLVVTFVDITKEKLLSDELELFKSNFEHLLKKTKTVFFTQDKNLVYNSDKNMFPDFQIGSMIGQSDKGLLSEKDMLMLTQIKKKVLKTGKPVRKTLAISIGVENRYYDLTVRPIYKHEEIAGIICISTDVTEHYKVEQKLDELKNGKNG